ncbi:YicC/YloC family endoribonuclease [Candidatus Hoaglandella endobia]|uniref:YicC family protein n=1 Tax=Candidatus Hoaglandella endobia TaxID=1778263 RepID=A0A143WUE9_9ENTR|nr:YicC/YloC family endoribonuclease [Candidatus Hoaglandella endobia]CUX97380.1 hypothetical protein TPER_HE00470 [Candidatus Hoaglandella endobia]
MISSMTAFTRRNITHTWGKITWELRSVNQRYLEIYIRLPEQFRSLDPIIRERIRLSLTRGKVECNLYFDTNVTTQNTLIFNEKLAKELIKTAQWVKIQSDEGEIDPLDILRWPGVMTPLEQDLDTISTELLSGFDNVLNDFLSAREMEGNALKILIEQRLFSVIAEVAKVRQQMPDILVWYRERLLNKLADVKVKLESNRLEQELVMLAQRIDITEELDRLDVHVKETYQVLTTKDVVGRRLDFIMQELNREANTLASKSVNAYITACAIELKVLIEQMREQIQNIE